ncbi:MAG: ABC transporter substrate-binding protein [Planctomycetota bacterium]
MRFATLSPLLLLATLLLSSGCSRSAQPAGQTPASESSGTSPAPLSARLALNWYPEVEHGGFLAADTLGLFNAQNTSVEIIPGGPGAPQLVITELAAGRIQFAVSDADNVVKARAAGVPIVALLAPFQSSPRCIMVHAASGFKTLADLRDIELAISDSRPFALWMKKKLPLTNVTMVPFNGLVGEFLVKPAFAQQAYVFSEPFVAKEKGGDPQVLMVSDIGFNPYASVLVTTEQIISEQPELVQKVVTASVAGWAAYLKDATATNAAIHQLNSEMSPEALAFGVKAMKPLCETPADQAACSMQLERWQTLVQQIEEIGDVEPGSVKPDECFTLKFLTATSQNTAGQ